MASVDDNSTSVIVINPTELEHLRANVLKSQIATYRLLARNLPVSDSLLQSCSYKAQLANLVQTHFQEQQQQEEEEGSQSSKPTAIVLETNQNDKDSSLTFSSATTMYRWLVGSNEINKNNEDDNPTRIHQHPIGLNPLYVQQEREKR
ncbi:hypothetical protein I4U23_024861 [Adineta vaga]|nr:hypothetical protein I4U23_024861 [Adineta vaga]